MSAARKSAPAAARPTWTNTPQIAISPRPTLVAEPGDPLVRQLGELLTLVAARPVGEARALLAELIRAAREHVEALDEAPAASVPPAPAWQERLQSAIGRLSEALNTHAQASRGDSTLDDLDIAVERLRDLGEELAAPPASSELSASAEVLR